MAVTHISEGEAVRDFPALLARIRAGEEFVIEAGAQPVARLQPVIPPTRTAAECIALLDSNSPGVMDDDFAAAVQQAIDINQQPFPPPRRTIQECIALCPPDSPAVDEDFAGDIEQAIAWHREPLNSPAWD